MSIYKGIFWYVPGEHRLIAVNLVTKEATKKNKKKSRTSASKLFLNGSFIFGIER